MRDHRKLKAFERADALAVSIYKATRAFPRDEMYGLVSQLRRAAVSVPTNIVEGCGRRSQKEYVQYLERGFGSLREVGYLIDLSQRLGFLDQAEGARLGEEYNRAAQTLGALIQSLRK